MAQRDLRAYDDLDLFAAECADEYEEVQQDSYHRLIEARGSNLDDVERGLGIEDMLSGTFNESIDQLIASELSKDERVDAVRSNTTSPEAGTYETLVDIQVGAKVLGIQIPKGAIE